MTLPPIESLILSHSWRGIERLAPFLPADFAAQAGHALAGVGRVLVTTGFYVEGHPETDGPPGALFLGRALAGEGAAVGYVAEPYILDLLRQLISDLWRTGAHPEIRLPDLIEFRPTSSQASRARADEVVRGWEPEAIVAIERCGRTRAGRYLNFLGADIAPWTAQVDELLAAAGLSTVAIGDGGNEAGMGLLAQRLAAETGAEDPVRTEAEHVVLATVSNWGAYGVLAYMSAWAGRDLLPSAAEEARAGEIMLAGGAIDGRTRRAELTVDGFALEVTAGLLADLRGLAQGVAPL